MSDEFLKFPENFHWGSATAAHQIEGHQKNDWTRWEKQNAENLAQTAKKRFNPLTDLGMPTPDWEDIQEYATSPDNYISGKAADHYNRYKEDVQLMDSMSHNSYRFSIEWSRIEPEPGEFDEDAIEHYHRLLDALEKKGIRSFVTLHHFTNPQWFADKGGWASKKAPERFERYVEKIIEEYGDRINYWITINEPQVYAFEAYMTGARPPESNNPVKYYRALANMMTAHRTAYKQLKAENQEAMVSFSTNNAFFQADRGIINRGMKMLGDYWWNEYMLRKTIDSIDFIALNYYFRNRIDYGFFQNDYRKKSDMGWELYPEGLYRVLKSLKKFGKPIVITENGLADSEDRNREWYLRSVLQNIHRAREEGVDVRGYLHWSFMDNFEWDFGFWPRFGLVEVDYSSYDRTPRRSAEVYADIIARNGLYNH